MTKKNYTLKNTGEIAVLIEVNKGMSSYYPYNPIIERLEVSCDFSRETLKIKEFHGVEEWSYRLLRYEGDNLANWQGKENAVRYFGEEVIAAAEKQVRKNFKNLKNELKESKNNPLWVSMKPIAEETIKHFMVDFNYHDCLVIAREKPGKFIWFVRESGTFLLTGKDPYNEAILNEEKKNKNSKVFYWNGSKLKGIDLIEACSIYEGMKPL
jgi:hypothetical protein